jgi:PAS domain S-box-containing protein
MPRACRACQLDSCPEAHMRARHDERQARRREARSRVIYDATHCARRRHQARVPVRLTEPPAMNAGPTPLSHHNPVPIKSNLSQSRTLCGWATHFAGARCPMADQADSLPPEPPGGLDERFCEVMDAAPVMIRVSGTDKLCTWFNKPWLEFTGRTLSQELGNGWTEGIHREDFNRCLDIYVKHFDARQRFRMQYRLRRHDGEYRWIDDVGIPRHARADAFLGYIGSCTDVHEAALRLQTEFTSRAQTERHLAHSSDQLAGKCSRRSTIGPPLTPSQGAWQSAG